MLKEGSIAPAFELVGDDGKTHSLKSLRGRFVILYFYPQDMTPGCTTEACEFNDQLSQVESRDAVVFGVSKDSLASHARFKSKYGLGFVLLSDPDLIVHKAYGAYGEKNLYGKITTGVIRSTFLIDREGKIAKAWPKVRVKGHVKAVLDALEKANHRDLKPLQSRVMLAR